MERIKFVDLERRISWGSIIGGVVTVLAISVFLSILGTSIGLFMFDPTSQHPASGIGTTMGIWTALSLIISMACGGFVAGKLAGSDGLIHGFLVWATTLIITIIFMAFVAVGAVRLTANVLGAASSAVGNVVSGVGSAVGDGVSELADQAQNIFGDIDLDADEGRQNVRSDIRQALRRSGVKELQPEYIQTQLKGVRKDLRASVQRLVKNPNNADKIIGDFGTRLQERTEKFTKNIDRNDLTKAIANNTNMPQAEVEKAVDEYIELINTAKEQGREMIDNLQQTLNQAQQEWEQFKQDARVKADEAANATARAGLLSFFALLVGAGICAYAGFFGTRKTQEGYEV